MDRAGLAEALGARLAVGEAGNVVINTRDPGDFMAAFTDGVAAGGFVFLCDPSWGRKEKAEFAALLAEPAPVDGRGWLAIPTGGSSGSLKLTRHDEQTLAAAVRGFCAHFRTGPVNAVGLLPMHHVSGLMAWMRSVLTGGVYLPCDGRALLAGDRPCLEPKPEGWFLSLVPTQLARLIKDPPAVEWLRQFRAIFIGGGAAWPQLVDAGAELRLPLSFSYGMTETAAMVAALRPEEFLAGLRGCGHALPHARIEIADDGRIAIAAESLFLGYYPSARQHGEWSPEDLGRFDENGSLQVLGRRDALINSGGEKIAPTEVEAALRASGQFADVAVVGIPDPDWGEAVVACYLAENPAPDLGAVDAFLQSTLAAFKRPRRYLPITPWPRAENGKLNRAVLRDRVLKPD